MSLSSLVEEAFLLAVDVLPDVNHCNSRVNGDSAVVFVHGYSRIFSGINIFRINHELISRKPLLVFDYDSDNVIERIAEDFKKFLKQQGDRAYFVVGHSLGGLVARYFVEFLRDKEEVRRVALVATPNNGTLTAYLGRAESASQMIPGSEFLARLNKAELSIHYISIWAEGDELVIPNKSGFLDDCFNVCVKGKRHLSVLLDARVYNLINDFFLRKGLKIYPTNATL